MSVYRYRYLSFEINHRSGYVTSNVPVITVNIFSTCHPITTSPRPSTPIMDSNRHAVELRCELADFELAGGDLFFHSLVFGLAAVELVLHAGNLGFVHLLQLRLKSRCLLVVVLTQVLQRLLQTIVVFRRQRLI